MPLQDRSIATVMEITILIHQTQPLFNLLSHHSKNAHAKINQTVTAVFLETFGLLPNFHADLTALNKKDATARTSPELSKNRELILFNKLTWEILPAEELAAVVKFAQWLIKLAHVPGEIHYLAIPQLCVPSMPLLSNAVGSTLPPSQLAWEIHLPSRTPETSRIWQLKDLWTQLLPQLLRTSLSSLLLMLTELHSTATAQTADFQDFQ